VRETYNIVVNANSFSLRKYIFFSQPHPQLDLQDIKEKLVKSIGPVMGTQC
jgi:hypothetical protein